MKRKLIKYLLPISLLFACLGFAACDHAPDDLPEQLSTPRHLKVEDGVLIWDSVEFADSYTLYFDNNLGNKWEVQTAEVSYDLSELTSAGAYEIQVQANSKYEAKSSEPAETEYVIPTEGLEFTTYQSGICAVKKFAVDSNGACIIPHFYEGIPVVRFYVTEFEDSWSQIKTLFLPNSMAEHFDNGYNFQYMPNLENIIVEKGHARYCSEGNCIIDKQDKSVTLGTINSVLPKFVTKIAAYAFHGRNLKTFTVPETITKIGNNAFYKCTALEKVVLPKRITGANSNRVLNSTFSGCTSLKEVNIPNGVTTLTATFRDCTSLESIIIPQHVESLDFAFTGCTSLKSVTVPKTVKSLKGTFQGCTSLQRVVLEEGVEVLGGGELEFTEWQSYAAFSGCTSLTEIVLPSTLKRIGMYSFFDCSSLRSIVIPANVTSIDGTAFYNCPSLKKAVIPKNVAIKSLLFQDCPLEDVYYRGTEAEWEEAVTAEKISTKNTVLLSATRYYYSETAPEEEGNYWHFVDGVPTVWQ